MVMQHFFKLPHSHQMNPMLADTPLIRHRRYRALLRAFTFAGLVGGGTQPRSRFYRGSWCQVQAEGG